MKNCQWVQTKIPIGIVVEILDRLEKITVAQPFICVRPMPGVHETLISQKSQMNQLDLQTQATDLFIRRKVNIRSEIKSKVTEF